VRAGVDRHRVALDPARMACPAGQGPASNRPLRLSGPTSGRSRPDAWAEGCGVGWDGVTVHVLPAEDGSHARQQGCCSSSPLALRIRHAAWLGRGGVTDGVTIQRVMGSVDRTSSGHGVCRQDSQSRPAALPHQVGLGRQRGAVHPLSPARAVGHDGHLGRWHLSRGLSDAALPKRVDGDHRALGSERLVIAAVLALVLK
jgi:hypothetical protein